MSFKPVLLLDVDGVVNSVVSQCDFPVTWPEETWRFTRVTANGYAWPIHYSTEVVDRLNALNEHVEIRWHTTWQHEALQLGRQLGFEIFPVQDAPEFHTSHSVAYGSRYHWWKMYAAVNVVNIENRPLIWCDDDLDLSNQMIAQKDMTDSTMAHFVKPWTNVGLTQEHFDAIDSFLIEWYSKTDN